MLQSATVLNLMALATLVPAAFMGLRGAPARDRVFWITLFASLLGPTFWILASFGAGWRADFGATLWVSAAATMAVYVLLVLSDHEAWRLTPVLSPTVFCIGLLATIWATGAGVAVTDQAPGILVIVHITVSVATYGLVTIAAVAALAALIQERALKTKSPSTFTRALPAVTDCDRLMVKLLIAGEWVLGAGVLTGLALTYGESGSIFSFDHKTILTITAFVIIAALLWVHARTGLRGRKAAKFALAAYLLLTLGYPGVKFVSDYLLQ